MARGDQIHRQWAILVALMRGRTSRRALAERFDVSLKTITRDIETLSCFPIWEEREGIDVFYHSMQGVTLPQMTLTPEEIAALHLGGETVSRALKGSPFRDAFVSALSKIERAQKGNTSHHVIDVAHVYHVDFALTDSSNPHQKHLLQAALSKRRVWIRYFTATRHTHNDRIVEPLCLHIHPNGVHLIAYCLWREKVINFNMHMIEDLKILQETFNPNDRAFDRTAYLASGFDGFYDGPLMHVRLRVEPPSSYWIKDRFFHTTQKIVERSDGSVEISFCARGLKAITARVLGLGAGCEVIEPVVLRNDVQSTAREIALRYQHSDTSPS